MSSSAQEPVTLDEKIALSIRGVSRSFNLTKAVDGISLDVRAGEMVGLLGPNGSGKTTTMKMVAGVLRPDSGRISVCGADVVESHSLAKRQIGYVPESPHLYEFLTASEYLDFVSEIYGIDKELRKARIDQFLSAFELAGHENELISGYSQGMKQKIAITAALVHRPRLLLLDEAMNGLDPRSAKIFKELISSLAKDGVGILFSTHVLDIAQAVCDRIAIMYRGKIIAEGTIAKLREQSGLAGSTLEEVFLKITGTDDLGEIVQALVR